MENIYSIILTSKKTPVFQEKYKAFHLHSKKTIPKRVMYLQLSFLPQFQAFYRYIYTANDCKKLLNTDKKNAKWRIFLHSFKSLKYTRAHI